MRDPRQYCPKCDHKYRFTEESCYACGFDPVNDPDDEYLENQALARYKEEQEEE